MSIAPDAGVTQLMFGKYKPEDQMNLQLSFSGASDAASHFESTLNNTRSGTTFSSLFYSTHLDIDASLTQPHRLITKCRTGLSER
jgi:hypothetical protein